MLAAAVVLWLLFTALARAKAAFCRMKYTSCKFQSETCVQDTALICAMHVPFSLPPTLHSLSILVRSISGKHRCWQGGSLSYLQVWPVSRDILGQLARSVPEVLALLVSLAFVLGRPVHMLGVGPCDADVLVSSLNV